MDSLFLAGLGNGQDGAWNPSTSTLTPIDSAATATIATNTITATNASFQPGQIILIHQTKGTDAGQWELNRIQSYTAGTITTVHPLSKNFTSGAQVIVVPQYTEVTIASGQTITAKAWNGTVGGIVFFLCQGVVDIQGTITAVGKGFRAGGTRDVGVGQPADYVTVGENRSGATPSQTASHFGGGGGSLSGGGGGGAYGTTGANGSGSNPGLGGGTYGESLDLMFFGGGGGGITYSGVVPNPGSPGGGIVCIVGAHVSISGSVLVDGGDVTGGQVSGGSGAGGYILVAGKRIVITGTVRSNGGVVSGAISTPGGTGGQGRIRLNYGYAVTGSTTPTAETALNPELASKGGGIVGFL